MSLTLFRYIGWRLISSIGGLFIAFTLLIMVIDLIENLRFAGKFVDGSFIFALQLTLLRALSLTQILSPFLILFGALWCFSQLNRRSEIAVMRSAGLSIWRVLTPAALVSAMIGVLLITLIDPISAKMLAQSEKMKNNARGAQTSLVRFFQDGIWLRQRSGDDSLIMNAKIINLEQGILGKMTVFRLNPKGGLIERIDAPEGYILENILDLKYARIRRNDEIKSRQEDSYQLPTNLTFNDLQEQLAKPETISVWNLNKFIRLAKVAGLPTQSYYLRYHDLLSTPLKLLGMVLIAAAFSMRPSRMGGTLTLVIFSIATGFILYIVSEVSTALGESGSVPLAIAAWSPALIATLFAVTGLLHLEDG